VSKDDTVSIVMPIKPVGERFNKRAQKWAEGLYRNDKRYTDPNYKLHSFLKWLNPLHIL
jgi:hypothetical protein